MNRRTALKWLSRILAAACAAVVAVPGASYVIATVRRKKGDGPITQRVVRLNDLTPGQPFEAAIIANWRDAWIVHPEQPVGRVWLVRRTDAAQSPVDAYSAVCPHMGCLIGWVPSDKEFFCPCHKGAFQASGAPIPAKTIDATTPPRPMDKLDCQLVLVKDGDASVWWVEVTYEQFVQGLSEQVVKT